MRYFLSSGEASGELAATLLAGAIAEIDPQAQFEGIGGERMRAAGFALWRDNRGWSTFGPFQALRIIPKLLVTVAWTALHLLREQPDVVVLIDFGAFHVRLAKLLRRLGYRKPIVDIFPPGAWLDRAGAARAVSAVAVPVTAFAHQRDFFQSLDLPVHFFGHPLAGRYRRRAMRATAAPNNGTIALLPGSRPAELQHHLPVLFEAVKVLRARRPQLRVIAGAATAAARRTIVRALRAARLEGVEIGEGIGATAHADAAFVASGTAVLECALTGVPCVALYRVSKALARMFQRVYKKRFITLPNLVLDRPIVPELLQDDATPEKLAAAMDALLADPSAQIDALEPLRDALGPADALQKCARFVVELAAG